MLDSVQRVMLSDWADHPTFKHTDGAELQTQMTHRLGAVCASQDQAACVCVCVGWCVGVGVCVCVCVWGVWCGGCVLLCVWWGVSRIDRHNQSQNKTQKEGTKESERVKESETDSQTARQPDSQAGKIGSASCRERV